MSAAGGAAPWRVGFSDELIVSHHLRRQMMLDLAHGPAAHHRALFAAAA